VKIASLALATLATMTKRQASMRRAYNSTIAAWPPFFVSEHSMSEHKFDPDSMNKFGATSLPGYLGVQITRVADGEVAARLEIKPHLLAPNGYLHAGAVVTLADTAAGYACFANLPEGANSFTTIELKSNHLGTARDGAIACVAKAAHMGRTTQVWDVVVTNETNGKTVALFRCTQMILFPK
jgi:1,4-dihydroxy-2-naphthoyl-CoA hydrolase